MPPKKRLHSATKGDAMHNQRNKHELPQGDAESHGSQSVLAEHNDDCRQLVVELLEVRKDVQCPICLGILRKTRIVMECLHRFCKDCIEKSMRLGNNECPACRRHCSSRRSLREDPNYDALISSLYPNIEKYEDEELTLHSHETENLQRMRQSFNVTLQRQTEAQKKKRPAAGFVMRRSRRNSRSSNVRRRRNVRNAVEIPGSSGGNDGGRGLSPIYEETEIVPESGKSRGLTQIPRQTDTVAVEVADGAGQENAPELLREIISSSDTLTWGRNGPRSNTRAKNAVAARNNRISRLVDRLRNLEVNDDELDIFIKLVSFEERRVPNLPRPYLRCRPTLSVGQLIQYVAYQTSRQTEEVELYLVKECQANIIRGEGSLDPNIKSQFLTREEETLAELKTDNLSCGYLVIAYKRKMWNLNEVLPWAE